MHDQHVFEILPGRACRNTMSLFSIMRTNPADRRGD